MKNFTFKLLILFVVLTSFNGFSQCGNGTLILSSQQAVDDFPTNYPGCVQFSGSISIIGADITDLTALSQLSSITGNLHILQNSSLTNLQGLHNLATIGVISGGLLIKDNPLLNDISGLSNLSNIGQYLEIDNNDALENLDGFNSLTSITHGYLAILKNDSLQEINGLQNLTSVGVSGNAQGVLIVGNPLLENLNGLSSLASIKGGLIIRNNTALSDVSGISITSLITSSENRFILESNSTLQNLSGMYIQELKGDVQILYNASLEAIDLTVGNPSQVYSLLIENNPLLQDVSGLGNITQATGNFGGFRVINNDSLQNLNGLNIVSIENQLFIKDNDVLENIDGLSSVDTMGTKVNVEIVNNPALNNLDGLANITKAGRILIQHNSSLKNIDGLSSVTQLTLTSDTKLLSVFNNSNLESIQGIRNINQVSIGNLVIVNNPKVAVCDLENICTYLGTAKPRSIIGNAEGCGNPTEIQNSCPTVWSGIEWSNGLPTSSKSAIIKGNLSLNTNLSVKNFTVNDGIFKVLANASLFVHGSIINNSVPENFIIENQANLVQANDAMSRKNQGKITVYKENTPFKRLDYTIWSSPVAHQNLFGFSPETINGVSNYVGAVGRIYVYEGISGYINPTPFTADAVFANAKGYLFRAPNTWNQNVPTAYEGKFVGVPNNGNVTVPTYQNSFTSIGNPYPSTIDALELFDANPSLGALYFWTNTYSAQEGDYTQNNYASYTLAGGTAVNEEGIEPTNNIAVGQGFIAYNDTNQVTFNNGMRNGNSAHFFRMNLSERHRFWLNLKGEDNLNFNQILVSYMDGATNGIDTQIDGRIFGYEGSALYSLIENEKFSIQGKSMPFEISDIVPLGFKAQNPGTFIISLANFDGLFSEGNTSIHLKDNLSNTTHNLENPYVFQSASGEFNDRFEVTYQSALGIQNPDKGWNLVIYKEGKDIVVKSDEEIQKIKVYDLLGRLVHNDEKVNAMTYKIKSATVQNEMLIIKVESNNRVSTRKIIN